MTTYFTAVSIIRSYHIYMDDCESSVGKQLFCELKKTNQHDSYPVVLLKLEQPLGMQLKYDLDLHPVLCWGGSSICCKITGERQYSCIQPQG